MRIGPSLRPPASSRRKQPSDSFLPRTLAEDYSQRDDFHKEKALRQTHKRTNSESSPVSSQSTGLELLYSPQHSAWTGPRPGSPNPEEDMSESEQLIWTIIKQRVSQTGLVVEEREEEEEDTLSKLPPKELKTAVNSYIQQRAVFQQSQSERRKAVKSQLLTLLSSPLDEEKLSQRQTPQMSDILGSVLRTSSGSDGTVTGPGGSFHMQEMLTSEEDWGNRGKVIMALRKVCLPGELFRKRLEEVIMDVEKWPKDKEMIVISLSNSFPMDQFAGIYAFNPQSRLLHKVTGSVPGPNKVSLEAVATYLAYDPAKEGFGEVAELSECQAVRFSQARCYY